MYAQNCWNDSILKILWIWSERYIKSKTLKIGGPSYSVSMEEVDRKLVIFFFFFCFDSARNVCAQIFRKYINQLEPDYK